MADIQVVDQEGKVLDSSSSINNAPQSTLSADGTLLAERVAQLFDLKPSEVSQFKHKLQTLIDYAKLKTDDHSAEGIKWALKSLGMKLGTPPLGEKLINHLYVYAGIYMDGKKLEAKKEQMLRGEKDE